MSRKKVLVLALVFAVAAAGGAYYLFGTSDTSLPGSEGDPTTLRLQSEYNELNTVEQNILPTLDGLFSDVRFQELKQFGTLPVVPGKAGRPNPFQPL